jgi:hypothetical protein
LSAAELAIVQATSGTNTGLRNIKHACILGFLLQEGFGYKTINSVSILGSET